MANKNDMTNISFRVDKRLKEVEAIESGNKQ